MTPSSVTRVDTLNLRMMILLDTYCLGARSALPGTGGEQGRVVFDVAPRLPVGLAALAAGEGDQHRPPTQWKSRSEVRAHAHRHVDHRMARVCRRLRSGRRVLPGRDVAALVMRTLPVVLIWFSHTLCLNELQGSSLDEPAALSAGPTPGRHR